MKFHLYQAKADLYWNRKKNYYSGYKNVIWYLYPSYHLQVIIYTLYVCIDMYNVCEERYKTEHKGTLMPPELWEANTIPQACTFKTCARML